MEHETWYCESCAAYVAPGEIVQLSASEGRVRIPTCPRCRRHVRREVQETARPLAPTLARAIVWPLGVHAAPAMLATGVTLYLLVRVFTAMGIAVVLAVAIVIAQGAAVIQSTARGEDAFPAPADILGWDHVIATILRYALVLLIALAPALAVPFALDDWSPGAQHLASLGALVLGMIWAPAAVIRAASARGSLIAVLDPITPIRLAWRMGAGYLVGVGFAWLAAAIWMIASLAAMGIAVALDAIPFVPGTIAAMVIFAGVLSVARVLGLLVREHRHDLGIV